MNILFKRTGALLLVLVLVSIGYGTVSHAQNQDKNGALAHFTITPVTYETTANPGEVISNKVTISNNTDAALNLSSSVENIQRTNNEGEVELTTQATPSELSSWVTLEPKEFTLKSRGSQEVTYTIRIPADASPGGHYGSLIVGTQPVKVEGSAAIIAQRLGSLLLIRVSGQANEDAVISSFRAKTFSGTWEEIVSSDGKTKTLIPRDEDFSKERFQNYFSKGPVAFDAAIKNNGNVHVKTLGYVTVYNLFHKKVAELPLNAQNIFPGSERRLTVIWPKQKLWGIYYRAQFVGLYGTNNDKSLTHSTSFWAFPLETAIIIGVALLILILIRHRLARAINVLLSGGAPQDRSKPPKSETSKVVSTKPDKSESKEKKDEKADKDWEKE